MSVWQHKTVVKVLDTHPDDPVGLKFEDATWLWIPRPKISVRPGDRVSMHLYTDPDHYGHVDRVTIGEYEIKTFLGLYLADLR